MLNEFLEYIEENHLVSDNSSVLLAVSGGIDSMVMCDLFVRSGIKIGIAHCNFTLRDKESDMDEELVREFAAINNIPFFVKRFDTKAFSEEKKISVQMAARDLRYEWFEEIREENRFDTVAIAHNLNDNIETFLINLTRGTGITGLSGIKKVSNRIIRPLLFASRSKIEEYCLANQIVYREDRSNAETKYTRNKIRHLVIPLLKEINPSIEITLNETSERLRGINEVFTGFTYNLRHNILRTKDDTIMLNISKLSPFIHNSAVLFELFRPFRLTSGNLIDLQNIIKGKTGGQLFTETHRIIKNRKEIIISALPGDKEEIAQINTLQELRRNPYISSVREVNISERFRIPVNPGIACIDRQKISFPLTLRKWEHGDYFYPFGMKQKKKLSDYFIDRKFSVLDKENVRVIESAGRIVCIVGERIDDRFRVAETTKKVLIIKAQSSGRRAQGKNPEL